MTTNLDQLRQKRHKWVDANRENGFDEGINRLLTDLYPDNAHFIYELLQNAEDPKSTSVRFSLTDSAVEFEHNGERLFTFKDVDSITSIGNSTKRDDATSIGKFGVGFKAVFAYTSTPEIHSGDFHFRIHDLVVPEDCIDLDPTDSQYATSFIFPFNNPKKQPEIAVAEIEAGLRNLGDNSLLFLSHIRKIEYSLPDGSVGSLSRIDRDNGRIEIHTKHPGGVEAVSHWLHFQKEVVVLDDDGKDKVCTIAIAYSLIEEEDKKNGGTISRLVPLKQGQVSIYFPAEKESSNLRFHLHAPFASTVARDSVRDCKANHILRDCISELVVQSLCEIRDQGLLTVNFLAVLPNASDNLIGNAPFYEPIRQAVIKAFNTKNITPTRSGLHAPAAKLFQGPAVIANNINDEDLSYLLNLASPLWVANPPPQSQREEHFLNSLDIGEWGWTELVEQINQADDDNDLRLKLEKWISEKDDIWLLKFYALLGEASEDHFEYIDVNYFSIVRTSFATSHIHHVPKYAFFPPDDDSESSYTTINFVKPEVYLTKGTDRQKRYSKLFLEKIGVRVLDKEVLLEKTLSRYSTPNSTLKADATYFKELKQFISYWKNDLNSIGKFKLNYILLNDQMQFCKPTALYLDIPYISTGLSANENIHKRKSVWLGYQAKFSESQLKDFLAFMAALGVMTGLSVIKSNLYQNPYRSELLKDRYGVRASHHEISDDYNISNLIEYLKTQLYENSLLIWNALINSDSRVAKARYRPNSAYPIRETDSQLVFILKNHAWIPDIHDQFCKPQDMSREDLRKDFIYNDKNELLTAICFGENSRKRSEEYQKRNSIAQAAGFKSAEDAEKWAECEKLGISPDDLIAKYRQVDFIEQPQDSVIDPVRRRKGVLERLGNAPSKESVLRERSIQPNARQETLDSKAYLRAKYTNSAGQLICQCCQNEMPFKVGDEYYFEAVQCVPKLDVHIFENRLALCPLCSAMYQHARDTSEEEIRVRIIESDAEDDVSSVTISVNLAGNERTIRFVGKHWFDLKVTLGG